MLDNIQPPKLNNMNNGLCQYDGCKSIATENGSKLFCHAHGGRRICCHAGCQNLAQAQGVCITHGWKKKRCSVDGCEKQSQSKNGMCKTHGGAKLCSVGGCRHSIYVQKLCRFHLRTRTRTSADTMRMMPGGIESASCPTAMETAEVASNSDARGNESIEGLTMTSIGVEGGDNKDKGGVEEQMTTLAPVSINTAIEKKVVEVYENGDVEAWDPAHSDLGRVSNGYGLFSIGEAWALKDPTSKGDYIGFRLYCDNCQAMRGAPLVLPVGNQAYFIRLRNKRTWYSQTFMTGFAAFVQHDAHVSTPLYKNLHHRIMLVSRTSYSPVKTLTQDHILEKGDATHFVSVAWKKSHFVVLYYDIVNREVIVYDGLRVRIRNWETQIVSTIKLFGLELNDAKYRHEMHDDWTTTDKRHKRTHKSMQLHFEEKTPWTVRLDKSLQQHDGVNCGPIACLKVLELYGFLKEGSIKSIGESQGGYRDVVVDYYQDCCVRFDNALKMERRTTDKMKAITT